MFRAFAKGFAQGVALVILVNVVSTVIIVAINKIAE